MSLGSQLPELCFCKDAKQFVSEGNFTQDFATLALQAAQVRKTSYMHSEEGHGQSAAMYSLETHHSCTVHAGTYVQQVL